MRLMVGRVRAALRRNRPWMAASRRRKRRRSRSGWLAVRAAPARAAPLGPGRSGPGRVRGLLRVRLLPRLGRRRGGRGAGRRHPLPVRRRGLPGAGRAVRRRRAAGGAPDDAGGPPVQDRRACLLARAHARPGGGSLGLGPGRHAARRLPRRRLPARARRPGRRVAVLASRSSSPRPARTSCSSSCCWPACCCSPARRSPAWCRPRRDAATTTERARAAHGHARLGPAHGAAPGPARRRAAPVEPPEPED